MPVIIRLKCQSLFHLCYSVLRSDQPPVDMCTDYAGELFLSLISSLIRMHTALLYDSSIAGLAGLSLALNKLCVVQGYAWAEDKEHCEEYGRMLQADPSKVSQRAKKRGLPQVCHLHHFCILLQGPQPAAGGGGGGCTCYTSAVCAFCMPHNPAASVRRLSHLGFAGDTCL